MPTRREPVVTRDRIGYASLTIVCLRGTNPNNVTTLCNFTERLPLDCAEWSDDRSCDHHYLHPQDSCGRQESEAATLARDTLGGAVVHA